MGSLFPLAYLAAFLGIPESTIRRWAHEKRIQRQGTGEYGAALYDAREVIEYAHKTGRTRWKPQIVA